MSLRKKQAQFAYMVADLIYWCYEQGYEVTFSEAYRDPALAKYYATQGKGIVNSLHCIRLAIDLNFFKDGNYLDETEQLTPIGEYWESQGGSWGGRFKSKDGNHFSLEHNGVK